MGPAPVVPVVSYIKLRMWTLPMARCGSALKFCLVKIASTLQVQGVEVGLVAKLAGHANPAVTLGHYTQAIRGGEEAVAILDNLYTGQGGDRGHGATSHHGAGVR